VTLSERKRTDCGWLIFFYMFVLVMIAVSVYGWSKGNVRKLIAPIARKPFNTICGVDEAEKFPYLFFVPTDNKYDLLNSTYCVDRCTVKSEEFSVYISTNINIPVINKFVDTTTVGYVCLPTNQDILDQAGELLL
jgi:hypothetical protein